MTDKAAKYLIARTEDNKPVAFAHFRFDMDDGDEVLYWLVALMMLFSPFWKLNYIRIVTFTVMNYN